ncbi:hypothetical protein [Hymenobacter chitinivorans]|uniref:Uncharacterized protein n=1 Tax=Hymenobacter chitinivorans DSM 11115 TaxID=1121954 RepID=A0A2M9ASX4_9BACT|nr:hypothetical protein [Hymenobacter chitinivorans]PJJ48809.1 hypothetical protein CLV45_4521 [Hymenobacter chitinivorans DSM 11115]
MLTDFIDKYSTATITLAQTTFMHLEVEGAHLFRIDFEEKVEAKLKPGRGGVLAHHTTHPLLSHYNDDKTEVYINSAPDDPAGLYEGIQEVIARNPQEWRDGEASCFKSDFTTIKSDYTTGDGTIKEVLIQGRGKLISLAPPSIASAVLAACDKHGVATKAFTHPSSYHPHQYSLLSIGPYYVIAFGFSVRKLQ